MTAKRSPPHNLDAERALLGAVLLAREARDAAFAAVTAGDFYQPNHQTIFAAVETLALDDHAVDTVTVADQLGRNGQLEQVGGLAALIDLIGEELGTTKNAGRYAATVAEYARQRRMLGWSLEITEAIYEGLDPAGLVARIGSEVATGAAPTSTWTVVDLGPVLDGGQPEARPEWLHRADGAPLLYPGRVHAFNGESESGKSWLATVTVVEAIHAGQDSLYIDWEDNASTFVDRLLALGAPPAEIAAHVCYVRPDEPYDGAARLQLGALLEQRTFAIAVLDGMAEALSNNGWDENAAKDVMAFYAALPRRTARAGAATILIDHLVKDKEKQGRYARGSTAKLAGIDGAVYTIEAVMPFGRGLTGRSKIVLAKDRVGWVRQTANGHKNLAEMVLHSHDNGNRVTVELLAPAPARHGPTGEWQPTVFMEKISKALEGQPEPLTQRQVGAIVPGKADVVRRALAALVDASHVMCNAGPRGSMLYVSVSPYRNPQPDSDSTGPALHLVPGIPPDYMLDNEEEPY